MSKKESEIKNYGVSIRDKLLHIARTTGRDYNQIITRFFQERILYRLSISRYNEYFVLKGGALLYTYSRHSARPTLDIDLLGHNISRDKQFLVDAFSLICTVEYPSDGVHFLHETITATEIMSGRHYNGLNITLYACLDSIKQLVSMDIGFGDIVIPEPVCLDYPLFLDTMPAIHIYAYSPETVVAEKFQTMIEKSVLNSRMKDFFDVYTILSEGTVRSNILKEAVKSVLVNRGTKYIDQHPVFSESFYRDPARDVLWKGFLKRIKYSGDLPFTEVMEVMKTSLLPIWEDFKHQ